MTDHLYRGPGGSGYQRANVFWVVLAIAAAGCPENEVTSTDPCSGVRCSDRGRCFVDRGAAYCACDRGFHPVGLTCVENDSANPCAGVDCSGHGTCRVEAGYPTCDCDSGYVSPPESRLFCFPLPPSDPDADTDAQVDDDIGEVEGEIERPEGETVADDAITPSCGDGIVQTGGELGDEECDDGNPTPGDGCEPDCRFSCRSPEDCDDRNPCTTDRCVLVSGGQACAHAVAPGIPCDDGEPCTHTDRCTAEGICQGQRYSCEPAACEAASTCDGRGRCTVVWAAAGTPCEDGDPCTTPDTCDGAGRCVGGPDICTCPGGTTAECAPFEDGNLCNGTLRCVDRVCEVDPATVVTCPVAPPCQQYTCDPVDGRCHLTNLAAGTPCPDALWCNGSETCDGAGNCIPGPVPCPVRECVGGCDEVADRCIPAAAGRVCRVSGEGCAAEAVCDGISTACPSPGFRPAGHVCRPAAGPCDVEETCTGSSPTCPPDDFKSSATVCRPSAGSCDIEETCTGSSPECPPDLAQPSGTVCRPAVPGGCDVAETCDGTAATCPSDDVQAAGTVCRPRAGDCDVEETCDGTRNTCPADEFQPAGRPCEDGDPCTTGETCNGRGACVGGTPIPLSVPSPLSPENGALTGSFRAPASFNTLRPLFRWHVPQACAGVTYDIQVDDSCTLGEFASCTFPTPEASASGVTELEWRPPSPLAVSTVQPVGRRYYWRVRACHSGACSAWSPVRYVDVGRAPKDFNGDGFSDVIVGATGQNAGATAEGNAFLYYGSTPGVPAAPIVTFDNPRNQAYGQFGRSVASAGDVNADGYADIIIGAFGQDAGATDEGNVFIYHGGMLGIPTTPTVTLDNPTNQAYAYFGVSVASAGDVNGDGYADIIIGANRQSAGADNEGHAFVYHGSRTGIPTTPTVVLENPVNQAHGHFGLSVASAGDVNGDGYADVIVGANRQSAGADSEGNAFVYYGSATGISTMPDVTLDNPNNQAHGYFGYSVASAGDVNGDGYADIIVGARLQDAGADNEGSAFIYHGGRTGVPTAPTVVLQNPANQANSHFGYSVGSAGDVNGDGYADVIVGAPYQDTGADNEGNAFIYHGGRTGIPTTPTTILDNPGNQATGLFGIAVGSPGDVNGNGYADVVIGASYQDAGATDEGNAFVYHGDARGIPTTPTRSLDNPTNQAGGHFGTSVASTMGVNGGGSRARAVADKTHRHSWGTGAVSPLPFLPGPCSSHGPSEKPSWSWASAWAKVHAESRAFLLVTCPA